MKIVLGPSLELHLGIHGSLTANPPPGIEYVHRPCTYRYLYREASPFPFNPFHHLGVSETVEFALAGPDRTAAHSSRLPVFNPIPWVVDADGLLAVLSYGQAFSVGSAVAIQSGKVDPETVRMRQKIMLSHYLSPRCKGILLRTEYGKRQAIDYLQDSRLLSPLQLERLQRKMGVVYPALACQGGGIFPADPVTILYSGRTFHDKGGAVALEVFRQLRGKYGPSVELIFVGELPPGLEPDDLDVTWIPVAGRPDYLEMLGRSHIFFSPTLFESFGMALVEAASEGLAVVTSCGPGMEHIEELLEPDHHALFVSNRLGARDRIKEYLQALSLLVENKNKLKEMGSNNRALTESGKLSLDSRNRKLGYYYWMMRRDLEEKEEPSAPLEPQQTTPAWKLSSKEFTEQYLRIEMEMLTGEKVSGSSFRKLKGTEIPIPVPSFSALTL